MGRRIFHLIAFIIIGLEILAMSEQKVNYKLKKDNYSFVLENIEPTEKDQLVYTGMGGFYMKDDHYYWLKAVQKTGERSLFFSEENTSGSYPVANDSESALLLGHGNDLAYTKEGDYFYSTALEKNNYAIVRFRYDDKTKKITDFKKYKFENNKKRADGITYYGRDSHNRLLFLVRVQVKPGETIEFKIGRLEENEFKTVQTFYVSDQTRYQEHLQGIFYRNNLLYITSFDGFWKSKIQIYDMTDVINKKELVILDEDDKKYDIIMNGNKLKKGWMDKFEIESLYVSQKGYIYFNANIKYGGIKDDKDCIVKITQPFN
ncbi:hypothetical protein lbkm_3176 [Lachnospiraceae bacterium KM106-2]|nr:hypothetical protein lbkm_3176 [Lachnospiraceae bacterium KM106-2]